MKKKTKEFQSMIFEDGSTLKNFPWVIFEDLRMKFHFVSLWWLKIWIVTSYSQKIN